MECPVLKNATKKGVYPQRKAMGGAIQDSSVSDKLRYTVNSQVGGLLYWILKNIFATKAFSPLRASVSLSD
jgi:hypothetical protein